MSYRFETIEEAIAALTEALLDVEGDFGAEAAEAGHNDIVRSIAADAAPEVAAELLRREGIGPLARLAGRAYSIREGRTVDTYTGEEREL